MIVHPTSVAATTTAKPTDPVATGFEAIFIRMMLKSMREASAGDELLDGDRNQSFRDMQDAAVADTIARRGILGLARHIERSSV